MLILNRFLLFLIPAWFVRFEASPIAEVHSQGVDASADPTAIRQAIIGFEKWFCKPTIVATFWAWYEKIKGRVLTNRLKVKGDNVVVDRALFPFCEVFGVVLG